MRQRVDVPFGVELRSTGAAKDLVGRTGVDDFLFPKRPFHKRCDHDGPRRQVDPGCEGFGAKCDAQQLLLEQLFDDAAVLWQQPRVVNADATP